MMPEGQRTESSAVASSRRRLIGGSGARSSLSSGEAKTLGSDAVEMLP
jgi:hypothetical protein